MIARIWHGWTLPENAKAYEMLMRNEVFPGIANKSVQGYRKITLLKREHEQETGFITIMYFDTIESVKTFVGENYLQSYVPARARELLLRYDEKSQHYECIHEIVY